MSRLTLYDPFAEVFPELFRGYLSPTRTDETPLEIKLDVSETPSDYTVHAELPGVAKDAIHVEIDGNRVSITGEVKRESEKKHGERVIRSERYYGSVARTFSLATDVDDEKATAKFDNGVLTLTLPKKLALAGQRLNVE